MSDPLLEPIIELATPGDEPPPAFDLTSPGPRAAGPGVEAARAEPKGLIVGAVVGRLVGLAASGEPLVETPGVAIPGPVLSRSTVALGPSDVGREVVLLFEQGDPGKPIVTGLVRPTAPAASSVEARIDGERLVFTADREISLRCGKASITLTADGNVLIRGAYVLTRASGTNRIRGGNVQIN